MTVPWGASVPRGAPESRSTALYRIRNLVLPGLIEQPKKFAACTLIGTRIAPLFHPQMSRHGMTLE